MECGATADSASFCNDDGQFSNNASEITTKEMSMTPWEHELCKAVAARSVETVVSILSGPDRTFSQRIIDDCFLDACGLYKERNQHLVRELLRAGASIKAVSKYGWTPILLAVREDDFSLICSFLRRGADVNAVTAEGDSALTLSIRPNRSLHIIKLLLLQSGIDTNHKNLEGYTALMKAVEARDIEVMKLLIDDHKLNNREMLTVSEDSLDSNETIVKCFGQELVDVAIRAGMLKVIKLLLHRERGESLLLEAALREDVDLVKTLIDFQLYCFQKEDSGSTTFLQNFFRTKKQRHLAIGDADTPVVQLLLENGAAVNKSKKSREPPVITAVEAGSLRLVQLMCKYGAKLDATKVTRYTSKTPLDVAAESGKADILQFLLNSNAMVSGHGEEIAYEDSALHLSLMNKHTNCAEILMKHGYKIDVPKAAKYAIAYMQPAYLNFLLEKFPSGVKNILFSTKQKGNENLTEIVKNDCVNIINNLIKIQVHLPDFLLSQSKSADMVQLLVRNGASVNRRATSTGNPVLLTLIQSGKNETSVAQIVKILLEKGANVNDCNLKGVTPLIAAARRWESSELLNTLLLHGADVHKRDNQGMTALLYAVEKNYTESAKLLIQLGGDKKVDIELRNTSGSPPLIIAVTYNNKTIADLLLDRGADVNVQDQDGDTALTLAARKNDTDTLEKIIERGADINHRNKDGCTALISAIKCKNKIIAYLLIDRGANVNVEDKCGDTALTLAVGVSYLDDVDMLKKILQKEVEINHQNKEGYSALMIAARECHQDSLKVLLNAGADVNVVSHGQEKKTAISILVEKKSAYNYDRSTVYLFMNLLLDKGASSSYLKSDAIFDVIQSNQLKLVPKLVSSGFGPAETGSEDYLYDLSKRVAFSQLSPFMFALLNSHPKLARYFDGNWFLSTSDIQLQAKHDLFKDSIGRRANIECVDILEEFCSQPMSLLKLSFVAVSSAIGCVPGREERVEKLPLPPIIKDKLLFKKQEVQLDIPESATPSRESILLSISHATSLFLVKRRLAFSSRRPYWHNDYD